MQTILNCIEHLCLKRLVLSLPDQKSKVIYSDHLCLVFICPSVSSSVSKSFFASSPEPLNYLVQTQFEEGDSGLQSEMQITDKKLLKFWYFF